MEYVRTTKPMNLVKFCNRSKTSLPVLLTVTQGCASITERHTFSEDQLFVALEKKQADMVRFRDPVHTSETHTYDIPKENIDDFMITQLTEVSLGPGIVDAKYLVDNDVCPLIAKALNKLYDERSQNRLDEESLLFLRRDTYGPVIGTTTDGKIIYINRKTVGKFSIRPQDTVVSLRDAVRRLRLPCICRIFSPNKSEDIYLSKVIVEKIFKSECLLGVLTTGRGEGITDFRRKLLIPFTCDIKVAVTTTPQEHVLEKIYEYSMERAYDGKATRDQEPAHKEKSEIFDMQENPSYGVVGLQSMILQPPALEESSGFTSRSFSLGKQPSHRLVEDIYCEPQIASSLPRSSISSDFAPVSSTLGDKCPPPLPPKPNAKKTQITTSEGGQSGVASLQQLRDAKSSLKSRAVYEDVQVMSPGPGPKEVNQLTPLRQDKSRVDVCKYKKTGASEEGDIKTQNITSLQLLNTNGVLRLLDAIGLSQYKEAFKGEHVDGQLLASLDSNMLDELGVQKSLHKMKIVKFINGEQSVMSYVK